MTKYRNKKLLKVCIFLKFLFFQRVKEGDETCVQCLCINSKRWIFPPFFQWNMRKRCHFGMSMRLTRKGDLIFKGKIRSSVMYTVFLVDRWWNGPRSVQISGVFHLLNVWSTRFLTRREISGGQLTLRPPTCGHFWKWKKLINWPATQFPNIYYAKIDLSLVWRLRWIESPTQEYQKQFFK